MAYIFWSESDSSDEVVVARAVDVGDPATQTSNSGGDTVETINIVTSSIITLEHHTIQSWVIKDASLIKLHLETKACSPGVVRTEHGSAPATPVTVSHWSQLFLNNYILCLWHKKTKNHLNVTT